MRDTAHTAPEGPARRRAGLTCHRWTSQPPTVRDCMTFERHVAGITQGYGDTVPDEWYEAPAFCFTNPY